jgi:hypothetical protein
VKYLMLAIVLAAAGCSSAKAPTDTVGGRPSCYQPGKPIPEYPNLPMCTGCAVMGNC